MSNSNFKNGSCQSPGFLSFGSVFVHLKIYLLLLLDLTSIWGPWQEPPCHNHIYNQRIKKRVYEKNSGKTLIISRSSITNQSTICYLAKECIFAPYPRKLESFIFQERFTRSQIKWMVCSTPARVDGGELSESRSSSIESIRFWSSPIQFGKKLSSTWWITVSCWISYLPQ